MKAWQWSLLLVALLAAPAWSAPPGEFRLAPGDVLEVAVVPQRNFDRTVTVRPDGNITYPLVGEMRAQGLTLAELTEKLRAALDRELVDPRVTISLKQLNPNTVPRVSVLGAVKNPGVFEIKVGTTLAETLASAGGPSPIADLKRVIITRADRSMVTANLAQAGKTGRLDGNVELQPGDLIVVPEGAPPTVLVLGEVAKPGSVEIQGEPRLLDAISLAGGPTTRADLRRVTLARGGSARTQTLDLQPLLAGKTASNAENNPPLHPGDTIVISETTEQVYVIGRVVRPDIYALKPNDHVLDVFTRAGGPTPDGDMSRAVLLRRDAAGQPVPKKLDIKKLVQKGDSADNELLRPGDVLIVPDKKQRRTYDMGGLLYPIIGLMSVLY